jgi:hypothetical protein
MTASLDASRELLRMINGFQISQALHLLHACGSPTIWWMAHARSTIWPQRRLVFEAM